MGGSSLEPLLQCCVGHPGQVLGRPPEHHAHEAPDRGHHGREVQQLVLLRHVHLHGLEVDVGLGVDSLRNRGRLELLIHFVDELFIGPGKNFMKPLLVNS